MVPGGQPGTKTNNNNNDNDNNNNNTCLLGVLNVFTGAFCESAVAAAAADTQTIMDQELGPHKPTPPPEVISNEIFY